MSETAKGRGVKVYAVSLTGKEWHALMAMLEERAAGAGLYENVRAAVYLAERARPQLKEQGFYHDITPTEDRVFLPVRTREGFEV